MLEKPQDPSRRRFITQVGAVGLTLAPLPVYGDSQEVVPEEEVIKIVELGERTLREPVSWEGTEPTEAHSREGYYVDVDELMLPELPTPDPMDILGSDTGLIISKRFHRFWLFKDGVLLKIGPVGTARVSKGMDTPEGVFTISRKEGADYMSGEFPGTDPNMPNMAFATFFHPRGIAFHGSLNFRVFGNDEVGKEEYLKVDNSHGCANALKDDAELVNSTLTEGDRVSVLP